MNLAKSKSFEKNDSNKKSAKRGNLSIFRSDIAGKYFNKYTGLTKNGLRLKGHVRHFRLDQLQSKVQFVLWLVLTLDLRSTA